MEPGIIIPTEGVTPHSSKLKKGDSQLDAVMRRTQEASILAGR